MMLHNAPQIQLVDLDRADPDARALFTEIQDTLGLPWPPAFWRALAAYPPLLRLAWERQRPCAATAAFLRSALSIADEAYHDTAAWYAPAGAPDRDSQASAEIARCLDAVAYGNAQMLVLLTALSRGFRNEITGVESADMAPRDMGPYRHPPMPLADEQVDSAEIDGVFAAAQQTFDLPFAIDDLRLLARWPAFLQTGWHAIEAWRLREEFQHLRQELILAADEAAVGLCPPFHLSAHEVQQSLDDPAEFDNVLHMVETFARALPLQLACDALLRAVVANGHPFLMPGAERVPATRTHIGYS